MPASQTLLFPDPRPLVERLGLDFFRQLTERAGVYLMRDASEEVLYVGKAKNLKKRLHSYRVANPDRLGRRHLRLLRAVCRIEVLECADETAALAKEAELLLALKPKFNRAGVWAATPRFLAWQREGKRLLLAITETPIDGWHGCGPMGGGATYLRAALARLLWYAMNPSAGSATMPAGWIHGRLGATAAVANARESESGQGVEQILSGLFAGDTEGFTAWIGEQTKPLVRTHDLAIRDADLETVIGFMEAKARRAPLLTTATAGVQDERFDPIAPPAGNLWEHE